MLSAFTNCLKIPELRQKIFFTLALLFIARVGANIPLPGVDPSPIKEFFELREQSRNESEGNDILGFYNILNLSRNLNIRHFIFSSTSSVYGNNKKVPFTENTNSDFPLSFYAATKKSNEVMAHSYANIYKLPTTVLRLFTVFGTFGRPDMAIHKFFDKIISDFLYP